MEVARLRRNDEHDRDVRHAWHIVAFYADLRAGKTPDIERYLSTRSTATAHTTRQLRGTLEFLSEQYGIPLQVERKH